MFAQTRMHIVYEDICVFVWASISTLALLHAASLAVAPPAHAMVPLTTAPTGAEPYKRVKRRRRVKGAGKTSRTTVQECDESSADDDATAAADDDDCAVVEVLAGGSGGDTAETSLYGNWQVQRHVPVPLVDGHVPLNAHGNFELWSR